MHSTSELEQLSTSLLFNLAIGDSAYNIKVRLENNLEDDGSLTITSPSGSFEPRRLVDIMRGLGELSDENSLSLEEFKAWFLVILFADDDANFKANEVATNTDGSDTSASRDSSGTRQNCESGWFSEQVSQPCVDDSSDEQADDDATFKANEN